MTGRIVTDVRIVTWQGVGRTNSPQPFNPDSEKEASIRSSLKYKSVEMCNNGNAKNAILSAHLPLG